MKPLTNAWKNLARVARQAPADPVDLPPGFAARVWAQSREAAAASIEEMWVQWSWRYVAAAVSILVLCLITLRSEGPAAPPDEMTILVYEVQAQVLGL